MSKVREWKRGDPVESAGWRVLLIVSICSDEDCRCVHELEQLMDDELGTARIEVCWDCVTNPICRVWDNLPVIKYFVVTGLCDGLGNVLALIASPFIYPQLSVLLPQTIIIFAMICGILILRTRYTLWETLAALMVLGGAVITIIPDIANSQESAASGNNLLDDVIMAFSTLPSAISFTVKELIFRKEPKLDVFVVNSTGSLFQLIFSPFTIPLSLWVNHSVTEYYSIWSYIGNAAQCFVGIEPLDYRGVGPHFSCDYSPLPYMIYICINLVYNIALIILVAEASALLGFMTNKAILPLSVCLFYIKWPFIPTSTFNVPLITGLVVILVGLVLYRYTTHLKMNSPQPQRYCLSPYLPCFPNTFTRNKKPNPYPSSEL